MSPAEIEKLKALERRIAEMEMAIRWACGEQPDKDGHWFGDAERAATTGRTRRRYWWRTRLRRLSGVGATDEASAPESK